MQLHGKKQVETTVTDNKAYIYMLLNSDVK